MARSRRSRLACLTLSNLLMPIAVVVFASGFFPYKPLLPGLATFEDVSDGSNAQAEAAFDRVIFMVVDALRSDFVYGFNSGFEFTQSLIRSGAAIPFTARATPPTVTMPRVKALTTGSVPSFLDLILNFAESDTTSSLGSQDTWLAQIAAKGGKLVFYGDDTWLKLFPEKDFFARADGTSSFFVSDFTEVDNNVTRHVPAELQRDDWNAMIMHYLGLDHIGHKTGPKGPNMLPKQREMDDIVRMIYEAMQTEAHHERTLLVLAGDHGMNAGGNHGGSGPGETEPALVFISPRFQTMRDRKTYECPTAPKEGTEFHYYSKIEQSDLVPALAATMGMPISKNSLGVLIPELTGLWSEEEEVQMLRRNARQILGIVHAKYGREVFERNVAREVERFRSGSGDGRAGHDDQSRLEWGWAHVLYDEETGSAQEKKASLYRFLNNAQEALSNTASSYDIPRMLAGMFVVTISLGLTVLSRPSLWPPGSTVIFFSAMTALYGVMMFASSYVEEEQHFWYWLTPVWIIFLGVISARGDSGPEMGPTIPTIILLSTHRLALRWNQTGQKRSGEPDIVHTLFPNHHILMWMLIMLAYVVNAFHLHNTTFASLCMPELAVFMLASLTFLGIVFKLNFTQADAPELVQGLALGIREYSEPFSLVMQARAVFALLAFAAVAVVLLSIRRTWKLEPPDANMSGDGAPLSARLHHLLTLFLMTQTRAPNIPLFLLLELQQLSLRWLLPRPDPASSTSQPLSLQVAATSLLLSNTYYFCMGGSNSISSIDLSNAYNGVADYNIAAVGVLLLASNWAGPIWWCSAAVNLLLPRPEPTPEPEISASTQGQRDWIAAERVKLHQEALAAATPKQQPSRIRAVSASEWWSTYISAMTAFVCASLLAVMAACTILRTHLFIWTVFSPKYLYAIAWSVGWHSVVNVGFGSLLWSLVGLR